MNEDIKKLEDQLEKATAAGDETDASLDAETASLREGWLALGRLIESARVDWRGPPELQYPGNTSPSRGKWPLGIKATAALAALAASLLVAAVVGTSLLQNQAEIGKEHAGIAQDKSDGGRSTPLPEGKPGTMIANDATGQNAAGGDELDWDGSLDTQIAAAGREVLRIRADWHASYDPAGSIYYRMNAIQEDLDNNTL